MTHHSADTPGCLKTPIIHRFAVSSARETRDGPELKRDENGQVAEVRLPSKLSTAMSFLTVIGSIFIGVSAGGTFSQVIGNRILIRDTWMVS